MSNTLGPLPDFADEFQPRWLGDPGGFSAAQMEAERLRCFDLGVSKASELWQSTVFAWWELAREGACDMDPDEHDAWEKVGELFGQLRVTPNVQPTPNAR